MDLSFVRAAACKTYACVYLHIYYDPKIALPEPDLLTSPCELSTCENCEFLRLCFASPQKDEREAFSHERLECGFGLMFLVSSQNSRIVRATGRALMPGIIPFGVSPVPSPIAEVLRAERQPLFKTETFPGDVETSHARSLRVSRASAEQGYFQAISRKE